MSIKEAKLDPTKPLVHTVGIWTFSLEPTIIDLYYSDSDPKHVLAFHVSMVTIFRNQIGYDKPVFCG